MDNKVLINWGSYDVDNFGDLLFPFLVNHYLGHRYSKIVHASPTGKRSVWSDSISTCTLSHALTNSNIHGLVIGGGNLISFTKSGSVNYVENQEFSKIVHPSFFYLPYIVRAKYGIPYAYNHIGVSKPILSEKHDIVKTAIDSASFISCRDEVGSRRLMACGVTSPISVGPDSAIDIAHVFPDECLKKHYYDTQVYGKYDIPMNKPLAVIHVKERYLKNQFAELSHILSFLTKKNIHPVFIPLGMCHHDQLVFNSPLFQSQTATVIRNPKLLIDILSILSQSTYYIGSSLHGAIASLSYQKKIVIVADEVESRFSKFSGFLSQVGLPECLYDSWKEANIGMQTHGLSIFKTTSSAKRKELNSRPNTWQSIYKNIGEAGRIPFVIQPNHSLANAITKHYFDV